MRLTLLPSTPETGRTPYLWLVYLGLYLFPYFLRPHSAYQLGIATATLLLFLLLYFRGYWLDGAALWRNALGITALGMMSAAHNPGAAVFFIYSACAGAGFERPREGFLLVAANVLLGALTAWLLQPQLTFLLQVLILPVFIAGPVIHFHESRRAAGRLLRKQEEVEHLSKIAERERIARDMHDVLGHTLSLIALKSELARRLVASEPQRAEAEMREVEDSARDALRQVRQAIVGYRSAGLPFELAQADKALQTAGVALDTRIEPLALPAAVENVLSLALREAVTNIVRHAGASTCHIALRQADGRVHCDISDNGTAAAPVVPGNGLRGMRERVEAHGGAMALAAGPGLRLSLSLPATAALP